ncbi:nitroreductase [Kitasatospora sp. NPDC048540]|uniref:nitroreductase n=1 Tax=unclassified Kitasatospora TaxID=2633591 RepID=UPI00053AA9BA|nr:nitroreductase [Kitasatospora sp. MBT63]
MSPTPSFSDVVRDRRAIRSFLDRSVPDDVLRAVLDEAQLTPSNSNTQPWIVHVVRGTARDRLSEALLRADDEERYSLDFPHDGAAYEGAYGERRRVQAKALLDGWGVSREDEAGRRAVVRRNLEFFGAPQVALLCVPAFAGARIAADAGMYAQTFLLALAARGLGGVAQTTVGFYADTVRATLGLPDDHRLLFGMSFGYPDEAWAARTGRMGRAGIGESVHFHE